MEHSPATESSAQNYRKRRIIVAVVTLAVLAGFGVYFADSLFGPRGLNPDDEQQQLEAAERALRSGELLEAELAAKRVLAANPDSARALVIAGKSAERQRKFSEALSYFARIPDSDCERAVACRCDSARILFAELGRFSEAETHLRKAHQLDPDNVGANTQLAYMLCISGRRWESAPFLLKLLQQNNANNNVLCWLGVLEAAVDDSTNLERCRKAAPDDPLPLLGLARLALRDNQTARAKSLLARVVTMVPEQTEAHAVLGHLLLDDGSTQQLPTWQARLPEDADSHPDIWVVRARWSQMAGDPRGAVRCYLEAVFRNPHHQHANSQLARLMRQLQKPKLARRFATHTQTTSAYVNVVHTLQGFPDNAAARRRAAEIAESTGRLWEARGWCVQALRRQPNLDWARRLKTNLDSRLRPAIPQTLNSTQPALNVSLADWPLPRMFARKDSPGERQVPPIPQSTPRFEDMAAAAGIDFRYVNGHNPRSREKHTYEVNGGGVGVLDFDRDGWPDIYLTQGCRWPPAANQTQFLDGLFRNLGNGRFADVAGDARIVGNGFGQGIAVGDYDGDGFPDLFVANIGENRLYHNLGDGTFEDVTRQAGISGKRWTSSCAFADFNGDGLPEIYAVNYLKGADVFTRVCGTPPANFVCPPRLFAAEEDRLYVNSGDGRFVESSRSAGIAGQNGKGLGIVVADFDGSRRLGIFVANDQVHNNFFINRAPRKTTVPRFQEQGLFSGLATDTDGRGQACMGVAAGDADGDGRLDLFVTNFAGESNCLYRQSASLLFSDATRRAGLRDAGFHMLGFGTQFLDAELDGRPDLVLTNGHVDDRSAGGIPYRMRPQFYRNTGRGRFVELAKTELHGGFFNRKRVGRALARIDWNRDGREDFVVSHLDEPVALVTNMTQRVGHHLSLRLVGVTSGRDAIGTVVTVKSGKRVWTRQLTAGDGYQASNERLLVFGLGDNTHADTLSVRWPSGLRQSWTNLTVDAELLLIEGHDEPLPLKRPGN